MRKGAPPSFQPAAAAALLRLGALLRSKLPFLETASAGARRRSPLSSLGLVLLLQLLPASRHVLERLARTLLAEDRLVQLLARGDVPDSPEGRQTLLDMGELRLRPLKRDASPLIDRLHDLRVVIERQVCETKAL